MKFNTIIYALVCLFAFINCNMPMQQAIVPMTIVQKPIEQKKEIDNQFITLKTDQIQLDYDAFIESCFTDKIKQNRYRNSTMIVEVFKLDEGNKLLNFTTHTGIVEKYEEIYFISNNQLIYAKESKLQAISAIKDSVIWSCQYYIENQNVIKLKTFGEGFSDSENINSNKIVQLYNRRKHLIP